MAQTGQVIAALAAWGNHSETTHNIKIKFLILFPKSEHTHTHT